MADSSNLKKLLNTILNSFVDLCECDGGAIYTVRKGSTPTDSSLIFEAMVNRSIALQDVPIHLRNLKFSLDDTTLAARTAKQVKLFNFSYRNKAREFSPQVDRILNYETRNMISAPLVTPRGDVVGVVQLLNKLPHHAVQSSGGGMTNYNTAQVHTPPSMSQGPTTPGPAMAPASYPDFDARDERLCTIMAGQAALAIENSLLLEEQERLMEGFVKACVTAIESRDPITSGHSTRVSDYTVSLAQCVSRTDSGLLKAVAFNETHIREIRYAAMLHDIGKISVREEILNKERKLQDWELQVIQMRLKLMKTHLKMQQMIQQGTGGTGPAALAAIELQMQKLNQAWKFISDANEPSVLPSLVSNAIGDLVKLQIPGEEGELISALTDAEGFKLSIQKGSLTPDERREIEQHVTATYEILKMVPWSRGLEHVPEIAAKHHEKLDGTGYPCQCHDTDIPVQSRMLAICDIYDALTADDRPYKRAMPVEKALSILEAEVKGGKLDSELYKIFVEAKVFEAAHRSAPKLKRVA